ncbi:hypothetical protein FOXB_01233 [Fusarium oxysporum f. sp. conglutinans Fo5176]|uniref:Uncharacterized protein n=1 Tax=Fusarium oxysporum (strain Fo5176) TaxID=660025 RepID=F9F4A8_FUSOF|nr:hypothetical protein FOXB_01233 [Fusarium oxysporum f. sp. conglutinans Fo5176]
MTCIYHHPCILSLSYADSIDSALFSSGSVLKRGLLNGSWHFGRYTQSSEVGPPPETSDEQGVLQLRLAIDGEF